MKKISHADILGVEAFQACRAQKQKEIMALKQRRRVTVGPFAVFFFECFETLWWQIQEMLRIEKGGSAQLEDELTAYNPLLPQGSDFRATLMFEIADPLKRLAILKTLGGIEGTIDMQIGDTQVVTSPLDPEDSRTTAEGKTSAVHFIRFSLSPEQKQQLLLNSSSTHVTLGFTHPHYRFSVPLSQDLLEALHEDLT